MSKAQTLPRPTVTLKTVKPGTSLKKPGKYERADKRMVRIPNWNDTGIEPTDYNCVVRLDSLKGDDKDQTSAGGIIIPQERTDRDQMAYTKATLLEAGGNAFNDWTGRIPAPGDKIMVSKYAGITREADPTDLIRVLKDKEILAVLT